MSCKDYRSIINKPYWVIACQLMHYLIIIFNAQGNYAVSGGVEGVKAVEAKAKSFKARMTVRFFLPQRYLILTSYHITRRPHFSSHLLRCVQLQLVLSTQVLWNLLYQDWKLHWRQLRLELQEYQLSPTWMLSHMQIPTQ